MGREEVTVSSDERDKEVVREEEYQGRGRAGEKKRTTVGKVRKRKSKKCLQASEYERTDPQKERER
jgi:hypothetical protein